MSMLWRRTFRWLALLCLVALPCGVAFGAAWGLAALCGGLALLLAWHLHFLSLLLAWQEGAQELPLPRGRGVWEIVFANFHRRVRAHQGLQRSLSETLGHFMRGFQALPDGVIALDCHRRIEWINERAEAHFALRAASDRGQALTNLIRQPDLVAYLENGCFDEPLILRGGRAENRVLMLQVIPYGKDHSLMVSRDITRIERMETMRRDFVANVSHELKTPLTVVAGFSEMLAENHKEYDDAEIRHYLSLIREQNRRMQRLIEDLLALSALESGKSPASEERIELGPMLEDLLDEARALSGGQQEIYLTVEAPAALAGCASELRSAFGNLVGNAVRYTPPGGRIDLSWRADEASGEFSVTDTGIGIAAHHLPRLTERFYRVDRGRSRETGGTGLGLAIVKHVLTRHQATLEIDSEPGKGSRFTARFPRSRLSA
jgi:two-component system phosphate regulon sensor histidine kinase PhoR